ncbi:hypothetical protein [Roseofilum casamattae]|uniref:CCA tRNA nucleotidyltransferase n=1 Tax=Roseofilum casamattae BLCC-M143 TaxID=3022442 RepID=A0ABT7C2B5_9CYAN|nr:hypothetical protein [Roseofilum casamattae]MDJ1185560.1 CCA tRNA nucleotidyltransferase [Roseofilum casamattae BLCC-M143]
MLDLTATAITPNTWPFNPAWLPEHTCLVGGAVRDALLQRKREYLDLDFVVPHKAVETARQIARSHNAGFVVLDAQRQIARVVFENATADFAQQEGESLEIDLRRRDFTINAIAYNPMTQRAIDPLHGCEDLRKQLIRMVSVENLADDPLRLLRAYRQGAQLGFAIAPDTEAALIALAPKLSSVAVERVIVELGYLLNLASGSQAVVKAWMDGVLQVWFPHTTAERVSQLPDIDRIAEEIRDRWPQLAVSLNTPLLASQPTTGLSLAKLVMLLPADPQHGETEIKTLKLSRPEGRGAIAILQHLPDLVACQGNMTLRQQYFFFQKAIAVFPTLVLLARVVGVSFKALAPLIARYLDPNDPVVYPQPLVTGKELMTALNMKKGRAIGILLTEIQIARIEGKITTEPEAIAFGRTWLQFQENSRDLHN